MATRKRAFFMGIGGTLMGSLAILAKQSGYETSGFDGPIYPPMSDQLADAGIEVFDHFEPSQLKPPPDCVIVGNANLPRGNPALETLLNDGLDYCSGAEWLGKEILPGRHVIAVAGTHGKTTTTAMIAWILEYTGQDPGYLTGGVPIDLPHSAKLGSGAAFVVEADEYDCSYFDRRAKFLHYRPKTLIINSIEYDHADIFDDLAAIQYQFHHLIRAIPGNGTIIVPCGDVAVEQVLSQGCWTPLTRFGVSSGSALPPAQTNVDYFASNVAADGSSYDVHSVAQGLLGKVEWDMLGHHNVANGLAALIAVQSVNIGCEDAIRALREFQGVKRRLEIIAKNRCTTVYSDFAHHPTAIRTTLEGLRKHVGMDRLIAVVEPRTHTMSLGTLRADLKTCCDVADEVIWFRPQNLTWDLHAFVAEGEKEMRVESNIDALLDYICTENTTECKHFVLMSNGAFEGIYDRVSHRFSELRQTISKHMDRDPAEWLPTTKFAGSRGNSCT